MANLSELYKHTRTLWLDTVRDYYVDSLESMNTYRVGQRSGTHWIRACRIIHSEHSAEVSRQLETETGSLETFEGSGHTVQWVDILTNMASGKQTETENVLKNIEQTDEGSYTWTHLDTLHECTELSRGTTVLSVPVHNANQFPLTQWEGGFDLEQPHPICGQAFWGSRPLLLQTTAREHTYKRR